ncbi:MAG: hypothetical protein BAJALOKI3v1_50011 [Promethearchaeota archaeon]|nr:MAG: hypothetical protein BAJALOKI3v1_50011 [Candidatus Lokiarchaeota archaeon]
MSTKNDKYRFIITIHTMEDGRSMKMFVPDDEQMLSTKSVLYYIENNLILENGDLVRIVDINSTVYHNYIYRVSKNNEDVYLASIDDATYEFWIEYMAGSELRFLPATSAFTKFQNLRKV